MDNRGSHQEPSSSDNKHSVSEEEKIIHVEAENGQFKTTSDGSTVIISPSAERALTRKFDLRILPVLAVMYLFNSLDKSNLGNAKTNGLEKTLHLKNSQYNTILSVFFVPYVLTAPILAILGKKYGPNRVLPLMMFSFGCFTLLVTAVENFGGLMTLRWFLGMSESAFFPLVIYYQTTFYRRGELASRLAIFYAAQSVASAFSGLLAFGVFQIHSGSLAEWRYLFIIEGCCTILFSFFAFYYLPHSAPMARFLTQSEKELAYYRMQVDSSSVVNEKFNLRQSLGIFKHWTSSLILAIEICLGVPLQSVQLFLPQIVGRLGYNAVKTNLYTVAPNVSGAVMLLVLAFASSRGTSAPSVLLDVWYNNNIAHEGRRIILTSIGVPLANLMGVVSSNIFQNKDAPKYIPALATTAAFGATGFALSLLLGVYMMMDNARRDKKAGKKIQVRDVPTERLKVCEFSHVLLIDIFEISSSYKGVSQ
ncbi:MAG: hypothetical protein Q9219_007041 [cf. Caloplaca sp. 3 TL-2023]